jgi:hypothetical protein
MSDDFQKFKEALCRQIAEQIGIPKKMWNLIKNVSGAKVPILLRGRYSFSKN